MLVPYKSGTKLGSAGTKFDWYKVRSVTKFCSRSLWYEVRSSMKLGSGTKFSLACKVQLQSTVLYGTACVGRDLLFWLQLNHYVTSYTLRIPKICLKRQKGTSV